MKQIQILGQSWQIHRTAMKGSYGLCLYEKKQINISTTCPDHILATVLLHEVIHATLFITGLTNLLDKKVEEAFCDSLGAAISPLTESSLLPLLTSKDTESL